MVRLPAVHSLLRGCSRFISLDHVTMCARNGSGWGQRERLQSVVEHTRVLAHTHIRIQRQFAGHLRLRGRLVWAHTHVHCTISVAAWLHACGVHEGKGRHHGQPYTHSPCSAGDDWTAKPSWLGEDTFSSTPMICFDAPIDALCTRTAWRGAAAIAREGGPSHSFPRSFGQMIAKHQNLGQVNKKMWRGFTLSSAHMHCCAVQGSLVRALLGLASACRTTRSHGSSLGRGRVRCSGLHSQLVACGATRATPS